MLQELLDILLAVFARPSKSPPVVVPSASLNDVLAIEAGKYVGIKSVGVNGGPDVEKFQRAINSNPNHENWCADFVMYCIEQVEKGFGIKSNIFRSELCTDVWYKSPEIMRVTAPIPGCIVIWQHGDTIFGHMGIVESIQNGRLVTIEGNTTPGSEIVREGDGVYRRDRGMIGTPDFHVLGFLRVF